MPCLHYQWPTLRFHVHNIHTHIHSHLQTTQRVDYVYPFEWTPKEEEGPTDSAPETKHRRLRSEFADSAGHRRPGWNTWQDCDGSLRDYTQPPD